MRNLTDFPFAWNTNGSKILEYKLVDIGGRLNWESFRPTLEAMYRNNTECGGRPNLDAICNVQVVVHSTALQPLR